jgi:4-amino-4-deoxy-L-arabinose transferase-like glycosyltransferase
MEKMGDGPPARHYWTLAPLAATFLPDQGEPLMLQPDAPWWTRPWAHCLLILIVFFPAIAPTLGWLEFAGGMENVTVATSRELVSRNDLKTWLLPTLNGEPRLRKPPVPHWITALGILSSDHLEWGARWPGLLASCLTLCAIYGLGRTVGSWPLGLLASFIAGSTFLFLTYARQAQYDVHLALWVTLANLFLVRVIFLGRWFSGCIGAGAAIGIGLMCKGPIALLQTVVPALLFAGWHSLRPVQPADADPRPPLRTSTKLTAVALGLLVLLAIALPWPLYVATQFPRAWKLWRNESTVAAEAEYDTRSRWYDYLVHVIYLFPWILWFFVGLFRSATEPDRALRRRLLSMVWLLVIPVLVMSFFAVRRNRYLLPMLGPAAILTASGVLHHLRHWQQWTRPARVALALHWLMLAVLAVGFPLWGAWKLPAAPGLGIDHWYSPPTAVLLVLAMALPLIAGIWLHWRWRGGLVAGTVAVLLVWQACFVWGYRNSPNGRSTKPFAQRLLAQWPDATVYHVHPRKDAPLEMSIYLNRPVRRVKVTELGTAPVAQIILVPHPKFVRFLPANCVYVDKAPQGKGWWEAYVLPANTAPIRRPR